MKMKKLLAALLLILFLWTPIISSAQFESSGSAEQNALLLTEDLPKDTFYKAEILEIIKEEEKDIFGAIHWYQTVKIKLNTGEITEIEYSGPKNLAEFQKVRVGDEVVVTKVNLSAGSSYYIIDKYRITPLLWIFVIFLVLVAFFGRVKGLSAFLGLAFSIFILVKFVVPQIISGSNPLLVSFLGAVMIAVIALYLAHGFNRRTSLALISTLITLSIAAVLSIVFVHLSKLSGLGSEDAYQLKLGPLNNLNLQGLLLGGIIIGALGVLDDITTSQTAAVEEIHKANTKLDFKDLYSRGISVGREHIASLVNTLVLAYVGASFPLLLAFNLYSSQPLWVTLNSEFIVEEVIRTLVGSSALIFAVPISTSLAAYWFTKKAS